MLHVFGLQLLLQERVSSLALYLKLTACSLCAGSLSVPAGLKAPFTMRTSASFLSNSCTGSETCQRIKA